MGYTCGRKLNYDFCRSVASTCISRTDLFRKDEPVYTKSQRMGWLDKFATEFEYLTKAAAILYTKHKNGTYMTDEEVETEARKYRTMAEFRHRSPNAYMIATGKRKLIKKFTWIIRCPKSALPKNGDTVYAYVFVETHAVYVGRSCNLERRDKEHRRKKNDSLFIYSKESGFDIPTPKVLHTGISLERGAELEDDEIERYRSDGWNIINRCRGGSIGTLGVGISKKKVIKTAKSYTTFAAFKKDHPDMASLIYRMNWYNEVPWLEKKEYIRWTRERCEHESHKYVLLKEFRKYSPSAYVTAKSRRWLKDYIWLKRRIDWNDFNVVAEESKKYSTRHEFQVKNSSAYQGARRNGYLDILYPPKKSVPCGHWDVYENVANEAKKFRTRSEWEKKSHGSFLGAQRNDWLDELKPAKFVRHTKVAA